MRYLRTKGDKLERLRKQAEHTLNLFSEPGCMIYSDDAQALIHGLATYQVELQLQNEELRRIQLELERERDRYSDLYDNAPTGFLTLGEDGLIREANLTAAALLGCERTDLIGKRLSQYISPEDHGLFFGHRRQVFDTLAQQSCELKLLRPDGSPLFVKMASNFCPSTESVPSAFRTVMTDISDRKHLEEALTRAGRKTEGELSESQHQTHLAEVEIARLFAAIGSATEAIVITDARGVIQYVNPAYEGMTGIPRALAIGQLIDLLNPDHSERERCASIWQSLYNGESWSGVTTARRASGATYPEENTVSPAKDATGAVINFILVKRDVTKNLRLESIAEAVNLMENTGYIFAGIRHEIGNPINAIRTALQLIQANLETLSPPVIVAYIARALDEIGNVEYLLTSMRNFNLYENPKPKTLQLSSFLGKLRALFEDDFREKHIQQTITIEPGAQECYADPRALQQVLLNVLTNAVDACQASAHPTLTLRVAPGASNLVRIEVSDNGHGISEADQQRLFTPFFTSKPGGTGLGLMIARKMLARMNGSIEILSQEAVGTTVIIQLPRRSA